MLSTMSQQWGMRMSTAIKSFWPTNENDKINTWHNYLFIFCRPFIDKKIHIHIEGIFKLNRWYRLHLLFLSSSSSSMLSQRLMFDSRCYSSYRQEIFLQLQFLHRHRYQSLIDLNAAKEPFSILLARCEQLGWCVHHWKFALLPRFLMCQLSVATQLRSMHWNLGVFYVPNSMMKMMKIARLVLHYLMTLPQFAIVEL